jgi:hypothetical protein
MISDAELNQIEERARAATEGPWEVFTIASSAGESSRIFSDALGPAADIAHIPMPWNGDGSNAAFIAAARTDVPALVAALREARGALREVESKGEDSSCPACGALFPLTDRDPTADRGHAPSCALARALGVT